MGARPKGLSIERINNDLGYFPDNCRWATQLEQGQNTRKAKRITFALGGFERTMTINAWNRFLGFSSGVLGARLGKLGWPVDKAILTPVMKLGRQRQHR